MKRPDNVVYNEVDKKYDASLRKYGTNLSAPSIEILDTALWKRTSVNSVNAHLAARYKQLKSSLNELSEIYEYNNLIYSSSFNFEPIVGNTYFLYKDKNEKTFLSIISPEECNFEYLGSFYLSHDKIWRLK